MNITDSPSVTIPNPVYNSAYGNNITLECIIISFPKHTYVYWQHLYNGTFKNITSQSPGMYGAKITEPSLTILRVTPEDSGQYTCNAVNEVGTGRSEPTELTVLGTIFFTRIRQMTESNIKNIYRCHSSKITHI